MAATVTATMTAATGMTGTGVTATTGIMTAAATAIAIGIKLRIGEFGRRPGDLSGRRFRAPRLPLEKFVCRTKFVAQEDFYNSG
ncbi:MULTISPECIES: hypothetical protein [Asticcacaulis]|uniref:hypothetical protein n=1 Tax=Asticcacaulis TaxID=76890 RepID=UPI001AE8A7F0|nr:MULTISPECIES: hypothetical protein [Asticcacaulis]MBP2157783.1 hypothetical protein [Asticcacaulis solisilvae]MDR6798828.1 hypothetical protein [Asticcacaulis sp. BE141]